MSLILLFFICSSLCSINIQKWFESVFEFNQLMQEPTPTQVPWEDPLRQIEQEMDLVMQRFDTLQTENSLITDLICTTINSFSYYDFSLTNNHSVMLKAGKSNPLPVTSDSPQKDSNGNSPHKNIHYSPRNHDQSVYASNTTYFLDKLKHLQKYLYTTNIAKSQEIDTM